MLSSCSMYMLLLKRPQQSSFQFKKKIVFASWNHQWEGSRERWEENRTPSPHPTKKEQSLLQGWNFLESNSSSVAFKTPKISRLHKMKLQTRPSLTSASIPSDMNELYFWTKVLNIWQKNVYWIRKQEQKTNKDN